MAQKMKQIEIRKIRFNNFNSEIKLEGTMFQDNLSFETILKTDGSSINQLINILQRQNSEIELTELIESEELPDNEIHYWIELEGLNSLIPVSTVLNSEKYLQIRA